jgi:ribosomal protein S18 acetylase RimI-like enzyme
MGSLSTSGPASGVGIRRFTEADIGFALEQTSREGWDNTRESFQVLLEHDPDGVFIAEREGRAVGMVTTTRYRTTGWVGNLIVEPNARRQGLGERLMLRGIERLEAAGPSTLRLEADPLGEGVYRRLGFVEEFASPRFRLERAAADPPAGCAPLTVHDLDALAALDATAFGDRRSRLLRLILDAALATYRWPATGPMRGYVVVQRSAIGVRLGPWVSLEPDGARLLLAAGLYTAGGASVVAALPGPNLAAAELLRRMGFQETPSSLRMVRGPTVSTGAPDTVYGLASGAVG